MIGITDYGHRGVPNVTLKATLTKKGPWNAAHFRSDEYDKLVADLEHKSVPTTTVVNLPAAGVQAEMK